MTKYLFIFLLALAACTASPVHLGQDRDALSPAAALYVIPGQSNAVGGARVQDLPPELAFYGDKDPAVQFADEERCPKDFTGSGCLYDRDFAPLAPRTGGYFGIELSAGRELASRFGESSVALLKSATSGTSLSVSWDSTTPGTGLYEYLVDDVATRLAELPPGSHVAGVFWIQGEADAGTLAASQDYAENLAFMILRLRQEWGDVPFVINELCPKDTLTYAANVRAEQLAVAQYVDGVVVVPTGDLNLRDGIQHYDAPSFITLGNRMADAMPGFAP